MLNLASTCWTEFRLPLDIQFISWDFPVQIIIQCKCLEKYAEVGEVTAEAMHNFMQKSKKHDSYDRHDQG